MWKILKAAFSGFGKDECGTRAAALAYSTIFALPPVLVLIVAIAGRIWGADQVQQALEGQFSGLIGPGAASQVHQMVAHGQHSAGGGIVATVLGVVGLVVGATGAFLSLQDALNHAWEVKPDPKRGGLKNFITKRLLSLGMVFSLGFLVAASLALSAAITAVAGAVGSSIPAGVLYVADLLVSLAVLAFLFAAIFKFLPDGKLEWKDVWIGGFATAVLFVIGKFAIGLYLGHSKPGDTFGAASAFAVLLIWIYYAGMIVLFGAEFTQEWAAAHGRQVVPREGAVRVIEREQRVDGTGTPAPGQVTPRPARQGGPASPPTVKDWILGLPVLYWLVRSRTQR